jgi:transposase
MNNIHNIGVDYHPYQQTIAFIDKDGEVKTRRFYHTDKPAIRKFYQQFPAGSVVGVEATGSLGWFEKMIFEINLELKIGNPRAVRKMALSPHKNDRRDAIHILELLQSDRFPEIARRSDQAQMILAWLNYRHSLVRARTAIANQLQAMARSFGMDRFRIKIKTAKQRFLSLDLSEEFLVLIESRFGVHEKLTAEIEMLDQKLHAEAVRDEQAKLLDTHSGVGDLTALCLVHTLGDVNRFERKEQVTAFVGLAPLDESSGEKHRIGRISKHGSRLLRFLLGQSAQMTRDKQLKEFYRRVSRRRGAAKAKVATARKLLERCYIMLRDNIDYEEFRRRGEVSVPDSPRKKYVVKRSL